MNTDYNIVFDTNLVRNPTPRLFFGALQEAENYSIPLLPTVYQELFRQIPAHMADSWGRKLAIERDKNIISLDQAQHSRILIEVANAARHWLEDEITKADSILEHVDRDRSRNKEINDITVLIPRECFKQRIDPEYVSNDRTIIAEAIVYNAQIIASNNIRSINHDTLNKWADMNIRQGHPLLFTGDKAAHFLTPTSSTDGAGWLYRNMLSIALPRHINDDSDYAISQFLGRLENDVKLPETVMRIRESMDQDPDVLETFKLSRENRPEKTLNTEERLQSATLDAARDSGYER